MKEECACRLQKLCLSKESPALEFLEIQKREGAPALLLFKLQRSLGALLPSALVLYGSFCSTARVYLNSKTNWIYLAEPDRQFLASPWVHQGSPGGSSVPAKESCSPYLLLQGASGSLHPMQDAGWSHTVWGEGRYGPLPSPKSHSVVACPLERSQRQQAGKAFGEAGSAGLLEEGCRGGGES